MKREEQILLYQFRDAEKQKAMQQVFGKLHIKSRVLPEDSYGQKVGFLLGLKGFKETSERDGNFSFPHEVLIFHHIRGKRLDEVMESMKKAGIPHVKFKAVVTPFNTLWTLQRLCETMQREHAAVMEQKKEKAGEQ